jgi:putative transcriptional regulator
MTPNRHPLPETLISYAAGTLANAISCVVACHLSLCSECADHVRGLEMVGGLLLKNLEAAPADGALAERAVARWSPQSLPREPQAHPAPGSADRLLPLPLAHYLAMSGAEVPWESVAKGVEQYRIELPSGSGHMSLLRHKPGQFLLGQARTAGAELALVLQGVYRDHTGEYVRGDVIELTDEAPREPIASGDGDCVCLIAGDRSPAALARPHRMVGKSGWKAFLPELRFSEFLDLKPAIAASMAVIAGIGLGWLLRGGIADHAVVLDDLVQIETNRLVARGALQTALETLASGAQTTAISPEGRTLRLGIKMTFQSQAGDYCRQYDIASASPKRYSGVACRIGDEWTVKVQALVPPSRSASEQTIPAGAGADAAMDAVVGALIAGDPLVGADEAALLAKGWNK